jgi:hypothetical protein
MTRKISAVVAFAMVFLAVAPLAYARQASCRVRRPPAIYVTGVPQVCEDVLKADVRVSGLPTMRSIEVTLDDRVVRRTDGRVRVDCKRLDEGRHVLRVVAVNTNDTRTKAVAFHAE